MRFHRLVLMTLSTLAVATTAVAVPLTYTGSMSGPGGSSVPINFSGDFADGRITGVLAVDQVLVTLDGTVTAGGAAGTFRWKGGSRAGGFSATMQGSTLRVSYDLDGAAGSTSVPLNRMPSELRDALK